MINKVLRLKKTLKSWVKKNKPSLYNYIISYEINIKDIKWAQLLWHSLNDIKDVPKCYCNKPVKFISARKGYMQFCSKKCMSNSNEIKERKKATNIEKYGVENPSMSKEIRQKIEETNIKKFGTRYPLMNSEIKEKSKNYFLLEYGVENPSMNKEIRDKVKTTNLLKYGNENYLETEDFKFKAKETLVTKYDNENYNNRDKFKVTMNERYGTLSYNNIEKIKETNVKKYNKEFFTQTDQYKKKMLDKTLEKNITYFNQFNIEFKSWLNSDRVILKCKSCSNDYEITKQLFRKRIKENENPCVKCNKIVIRDSKQELEIVSFIETLGVEYIRNDRTVLKNKELDIYLPNEKIAIEFNGLYWHSDLFKDKKYHYDKMISCYNKGINLIQIWEDQWLYKKDIVKSILLSKLGKLSNRIYARKCKIRNISYKDTKKFLEENHLQGNCSSSIRYGLYHNNELISIMTFGKLRKNLNQEHKDGSFEMLRFCSSLNTHIIGGFSKLFKHFIRNNDINNIISYANCDYSNGSVYEKNSFKQEHFTKENYHYVKNKERFNRYKFRKDILVKHGYDEKMTEREIMLNLGYDRIYDSGSIKYILKIETVN